MFQKRKRWEKVHKAVCMCKISGFAVSSMATSGTKRTVSVSLWGFSGCGGFILIPKYRTD